MFIKTIIVGIIWTLLGLLQYYLYKKSNIYLTKVIGITMIVIGMLIFILGIINLFLKSYDFGLYTLVLIIPAVLYIFYKMKQYDDAKKVIDKLTKK